MYYKPQFEQTDSAVHACGGGGEAWVSELHGARSEIERQLSAI